MMETRPMSELDANDPRQRIKGTVRERPWLALAVAVGVGAAIGARRTDARRIAQLRSERLAHRGEPGLLRLAADRLRAGIATSFAPRFDDLLETLRGASRQLAIAMLAAEGARHIGVSTARRVAQRADRVAAESVPVPPEMTPAELGARAEAIEDQGGGTHEPPLAPGAGDLGSRYA
jgi:hypothetical protein